MLDTLVYNLNQNENDYNDDYQSRAEYGNYLYGRPFGPNKTEKRRIGNSNRSITCISHGCWNSRSDTTIGTLSIYSITSADTQLVFPDGVSRLANRDLADLVQTQIVNDIRTKYD